MVNKPWFWPLVFFCLAAFFAGLLHGRYAHAHDWYSSTSDPVYQSNCCGGHDCAPVDPAWVSETKDGFRLQMTVQQAMTVNPAAVNPVDAIIPWSRVQSPPNSRESPFYACIYDRDRTLPKGGVICFFATPTM